MVRRLVGQAGIQRSPQPIRSARQRRRATDQRLTQRAAQLGFASLRAYLVDRVTQKAWPLTQVADELGIDRNTGVIRWSALCDRTEFDQPLERCRSLVVP